MSKIIGIIGGMGPLATAKMYERIILNTKASADQDHPHTIIDSNTNIPDRTNYIFHKGDDPRVELIKSAKRLQTAGADLLIMPCNTAHYFYNDINKEVEIPFINMIEKTVSTIKRKYKSKSVGILATNGTISSGVYSDELEKHNLTPIMPSEKGQKAVMELIYNIKKGIYNSDIKTYIDCIEEMRLKGATTFIIGCTELSVAEDMYDLPSDLNYIDAMEILAREAIIKAGCDILDGNEHMSSKMKL